MDSDTSLLERYRAQRDAEAFAQLVQRHAAMVFATARRVTGCPHAAEDVAQACFLDLARNAGSVRSSLAGWLHSAATHRAINSVRDAATRRKHEQAHAAARPASAQTEPAWDEIAPLVDAAIGELSDDLRIPLVLHFLQGKTHTQVAAEMNVSRPTITRRLEAAVDALRANLKASGVAASAASLASLLAAQADAAATVPPTLLASLGKLAAAGIGPTGAVAGSSGPGTAGLLAKGAIKTMAWTKLRVAAVIVAAGVGAVGTGVVLQSRIGSATTNPSQAPAPAHVVTLRDARPADRPIEAGDSLRVSIMGLTRPNAVVSLNKVVDPQGRLHLPPRVVAAIPVAGLSLADAQRAIRIKALVVGTAMGDDAAHFAQGRGACPRVPSEFKNPSDPAHLAFLRVGRR